MEPRNRSGEFEFVEFVEVVKLLLLRMREATQAEGTFEEMQVESSPLRAVHLSRRKWPEGLVNNIWRSLPLSSEGGISSKK